MGWIVVYRVISYIFDPVSRKPCPLCGGNQMLVAEAMLRYIKIMPKMHIFAN